MSLTDQEFSTLTARFDLEDWRTLRNEDYWKSDEIKDPIQKMNYKLVRIRHYYKYGNVLQ